MDEKERYLYRIKKVINSIKKIDDLKDKLHLYFTDESYFSFDLVGFLKNEVKPVIERIVKNNLETEKRKYGELCSNITLMKVDYLFCIEPKPGSGERFSIREEFWNYLSDEAKSKLRLSIEEPEKNIVKCYPELNETFLEAIELYPSMDEIVPMGGYFWGVFGVYFMRLVEDIENNRLKVMRGIDYINYLSETLVENNPTEGMRIVIQHLLEVIGDEKGELAKIYPYISKRIIKESNRNEEYYGRERNIFDVDKIGIVYHKYDSMYELTSFPPDYKIYTPKDLENPHVIGTLLFKLNENIKNSEIRRIHDNLEILSEVKKIEDEKLQIRLWDTLADIKDFFKSPEIKERYEGFLDKCCGNISKIKEVLYGKGNKDI